MRLKHTSDQFNIEDPNALIFPRWCIFSSTSTSATKVVSRQAVLEDGIHQTGNEYTILTAENMKQFPRKKFGSPTSLAKRTMPPTPVDSVCSTANTNITRSIAHSNIKRIFIRK